MPKTSNTSLKDAIVDIAKSLESVFKRYTRNTRSKAWEKITSKDGEREIKKIIQDPARQINTFQKLATQKESTAPSFSAWVEMRDRINID